MSGRRSFGFTAPLLLAACVHSPDPKQRPEPQGPPPDRVHLLHVKDLHEELQCGDELRWGFLGSDQGVDWYAVMACDAVIKVPCLHVCRGDWACVDEQVLAELNCALF